MFMQIYGQASIKIITFAIQITKIYGENYSFSESKRRSW